MAICPNDFIGFLNGYVRCVRIGSSQAGCNSKKALMWGNNFGLVLLHGSLFYCGPAALHLQYCHS